MNDFVEPDPWARDKGKEVKKHTGTSWKKFFLLLKGKK
jgi:hypothetical protein